MSEFKDKIIGGFRVLQEIQAGSGSQGTVYKAVCDEDKYGLVQPGTLVALKVMAVQDDAKQQWKKLEKRTAELCLLNHPNVVRYYGCFSEPGLFNDVHVVVQEYLDGETLKERLAKNRCGLDADIGLKVSDAALAGLEYIARCGIVHRDIKPGNIFVCDDGSVKLIDFEIAKQRGGTTTSTAGNIRGSFDYMAPDFTDPEFHGDETSDVFSMGVVVHETLVGKTPYQRLEGEGKQANFAFLSRWSRALTDGTNPIYVSSRVKRLLAHAAEVLEKALAPKREERYQKFSEFREALKAVKFRILRNGDISYQILQFIGKGGFGEVFKARNRKTKELVAVKHLLKANYAERFKREAKIMKKFNDPCFVRLVDFFIMDISNSQEAFLVMAFLDGMPGSSLRDAIRSADGGLDPRDVFTAFERYAHGLGMMHESGIFHRDIKPSNLYYPAGNVAASAIMDLGIARDVNGTATQGQVPGTLDYMPPEVVLTDNRGDGGMDVYALGLCLYEALTGKTAYPRLPTGTASYTAFFERAKSRELPAFTDPTVVSDDEVRTLLVEMTNPDPAFRTKDAKSVADRIAKILHARYGGPKPSQQPVDDDLDPETVAPTVAYDDPATRATEATQWGGVGSTDIRNERKRFRRRKMLVPAAVIAVVVAVAAAVGWGPLSEYLERRSAEKAAVSQYTKLMTACVLPDGRLDHDGFRELEKSGLPGSRAVMSGISGEFAKLAGSLAATVRDNLKIDPPLTFRSRINRSRQLLDSQWAAMVMQPGEIDRLRRELEEVAGWSVSIVKNGCNGPIWVDGAEIPPGGSKDMVYKDGHPENGTVARPGFKPVHLPKDIDGKVYEVVDATFSSDKPVKSEAAKASPVPRPAPEAVKPAPPPVPLTVDPKFAEEFRLLTADEPVDTRRKRLDDAAEAVTAALEERKLPEADARKMLAEVETRRRWIVGKVLNEGNAEVSVGGRGIPAGTEELLVFKDGLPKTWTCSAPGYESSSLSRDFEGRILKVSVSELVPAPVNVAMASLGHGVACLFDGMPVKETLRLKPGKYSCVYRRNGYRDQTVEFEVAIGTPRTMPAPGQWQAEPVAVTVPQLQAGVSCRVDGVAAAQGMTLLPGEHRCEYFREDYESQSIKFTVVPATAVTLPLPGTWTASPGLKRLEAAAAYAKNGDWEKAKAAIEFSDVRSEANKAKKAEIEKLISGQSRISEKCADAEFYLSEGMHYDAAKLYFQAANEGYVLTAKDQANFQTAYDTASRLLQQMIDKCHKDIAVGRSPVRPLADLEEEKRNLIEWRMKIRRR